MFQSIEIEGNYVKKNDKRKGGGGVEEHVNFGH